MKCATSQLLHAMNFMNFTVEEIRSRSWASAAFAGVRHELTLALSGSDANSRADAFLCGLGDREFALDGHLLADIALVSRADTAEAGGPLVRLKLEALTVESG